MPKAKTNLKVVVPKELPLWRFVSPYGTIAIYSPTKTPLTPERVLLLVEQAKFELLYNQNTRK